MIWWIAKVQEWHARAWPDASDDLVALKLCEEAGEVAAAVGKRHDATAVLEECADTVIVAFALARRYGTPDEFLRRLSDKFERIS